MSSGRLQEVKTMKNYNAVTSKSARGCLREVVVLREVPTLGL